ncbi:Uncharacterised protein [Achromobacter insolitus]|uniref:hypothetical protein n=1 Tax=Achromobacter insolitus TaxID=217204 RepID=UPI0009728649|nr:hypothetical protein [Achromobacter insolitus]APX76193.1 hypothetical protein BUW96_15875 [Achromobacter insolitus]CAB3723627.1 hypothetical protein LMG6003_04135 [Achromobacter insolitus]VEG66500.1 Uncharacterised protein [Achromobacter insolitus]
MSQPTRTIQLKKFRDYWFGIAVSLLLASLLAFLGIVFVSADNLGWGAQALLSYGVILGGPLAVLLALCWIVYMVRDKGRVPGRVHALLFLPALSALSIVPISDSIERSRQDSFRESNPAIQETHVNLSGHGIWPDMRGGSISSGASRYLEPASAEQRMFLNLHRYPNPGSASGDLFPYVGARLRDGVDRYVYSSQDGEPAASLPLRRLPYPDLGKLPSAFAYGEAALVVYQYYHYADHVEVAPGIARFAGTTESQMEAAGIPGLALFGLENLTQQTIARVEINGQSYDMGSYAARSLLSRPCDPMRGGSPVLLDLDQPVRVRWQTIETPGAWREATITVPAFTAASKKDPDKGLLRVRLYFLPDGTVAAERYKEIRARGELFVRATGLPAAAQAYTGCGGAYFGYNPQTVKLLDN